MCTQPNEPMYRVEWRASRLGARMPTTQKTKKVGRWHRGVMPAPHYLFFTSPPCAWWWIGRIAVYGLALVAQVRHDDHSAEHGNGDTVAEVLADRHGDVHW